MLIPRFTIRWLLGLTTLAAGVSLVLSYAVRGRSWAIGVAAGLWTFVIVAVLFATAFLCAWLIEQLMSPRRASAGPGGSPFGSQQPPADTPPAMTG